MLLRLDFSDETPIYLQIRNQIVIGIASGAMKRGERLPTIRALANESGINMMTANKAYALLKQEGYIVADRRSGARVSEKTPDTPQKAAEELRLIASQFKLAGLNKAEFLRLCEEAYALNDNS